MVRKTKNVSTGEKPSVSYSAEIQQHEDAALKTSMLFFAEELLPYLHIEGKVVSFAPTELVRVEVQKLYQDFNLVMENGSWKHFGYCSHAAIPRGVQVCFCT